MPVAYCDRRGFSAEKRIQPSLPFMGLWFLTEKAGVPYGMRLVSFDMPQ